MATVLDSFVERLGGYGEIEVRDDRTAVLRASATKVDVGGAPPGFTLTIELPESAAFHATASLRGDAPDHLSLACGSAPDQIPLELTLSLGTTEGVVAVSSGRRETVVRGETSALGGLDLEGTSFHVSDLGEIGLLRLAPPAPDASIALTAGTPIKAREIGVDGEATLAGSAFECSSLMLSPEPLRLDGSLLCRKLSASQPAGPGQVSGTGVLTVAGEVEVGVLPLEGATLRVSQPGPQDGSLSRLEVSGRGHVEMHRDCQRARISSTGRTSPISLLVAENVTLRNLTGHFKLESKRGSTCSGDRAGGFAPYSISAAKQTQIYRLSPYLLSSSDDLTNLLKTSQLSMWLPRSGRERTRLESKMVLGRLAGGTKAEVAQFWEQMVVLLQNTHATETVKSRARTAAARARRRSLPWGAERVLLTLYAAVGYGERIVLPAIWYAALTLLVGWKLSGLGYVGRPSWSGAKSLARWWFDVARSPLAVIELAKDPIATNGLFEDALLLATQLAALVLLVIIVIAARRTVRMERLK